MQLPLVFLDGPWKLAMGLNALDPADWLWRDDALRRRDRRAPGAAARAAGRGPGHAARGRAGRAPSWSPWSQALSRLGRRPRIRDLDRLAGLAQEDFCVMQAQPDGAYALTAALLCFPAHWRLAEKLGRP